MRRDQIIPFVWWVGEWRILFTPPYWPCWGWPWRKMFGFRVFDQSCARSGDGHIIRTVGLCLPGVECSLTFDTGQINAEVVLIRYVGANATKPQKPSKSPKPAAIQPFPWVRL